MITPKKKCSYFSSWHYIGLGLQVYKNVEMVEIANIVRDLFSAIGEFCVLNNELNTKFEPSGFPKVQKTCERFNKRLVYYEDAVRSAGLDV